MAGIYIPGMTIDEYEELRKYARYGANNTMIGNREAIFIPDHGDLIDRNVLKENEQWWDNDYAEDGYDHIITIRDIENAPTIISADI